jgi:hypothetical protein
MSNSNVEYSNMGAYSYGFSHCPLCDRLMVHGLFGIDAVLHCSSSTEIAGFVVGASSCRRLPTMRAWPCYHACL